VLVQKVFKSVEWPNELKGHGPPFIAPKRNLPIGVSEIQTCPGWRPDMSAKRLWNPALPLDMSSAGT
jgi:hypothetical protein